MTIMEYTNFGALLWRRWSRVRQSSPMSLLPDTPPHAPAHPAPNTNQPTHTFSSKYSTRLTRAREDRSGHYTMKPRLLQHHETRIYVFKIIIILLYKWHMFLSNAMITNFVRKKNKTKWAVRLEMSWRKMVTGYANLFACVGIYSSNISQTHQASWKYHK